MTACKGSGLRVALKFSCSSTSVSLVRPRMSTKREPEYLRQANSKTRSIHDGDD